MTIKEKREALENACDTHRPLCTSNGECPFYRMGCDCDFYGATIPEVERYYDILIGSGESEGEATPDAAANPVPDNVNHPSHYTQGGMECIDEMLLIFGKEAVKNFCICNAWKYRKRAMFKNGQEDIDKSDWYINKYKELNEVG